MIKHIFATEIDGKIDELFEGCCGLSSYLDNLRAVSVHFPDCKHFVEHGFQAFIEAICLRQFLEYTPENSIHAELMVHGLGTTFDDVPVAVLPQVKLKLGPRFVGP